MVVDKKRIKKYVMNFVAFSLGCVAALALFEIGLRIYNPIESRVRGDEIILPINKKYISKSNNFKGTDRTIVHTKNSLGFRGPELPKNGLKDYLSIIAVGGSTTECRFLSDGKDWPLVLQEHLRNDFDQVWLNNAGLDGHTTFGHTILLRDIILNLKPKLVIFLIGANDRGLKKKGEHTSSHILGSLKFNSIEGFVKSASAYSELASLALNIYRYLRALFKGLPHKEVDITSLPHADSLDSDLSAVLESHINTFVPAFKRRLKKIIKLAKSNQINPVLVTQPLLYGKGIDPATGVNLSTLRIDNHTTGHAAWAILELYNEATKKVGRQENVLTIDLAQELEKTSDYFYDGLHFTNSGSAAVARIIYMHFRPYMLEKYSLFALNVKEKEKITAK